MKIKNPFSAKNWTVGQIVLAIWVVFATVFVLVNAWQALNGMVFQQGVQRGALLGQNNTITRVIELSAECNTVSLYAGEGEDRVEVALVDSTCSAAQIKAAQDAAKAANEEAVISDEEAAEEIEEAIEEEIEE